MDEANTDSQSINVEELKNKGNECVKDGKFIEAVFHYTQAINMDPTNHVLYSKRSFAFLNLGQHYFSLQDANETIKLQPQWAKGYFRRAEVEAANELYDDAILSYTCALALDLDNPKLLESIEDIKDRKKKMLRAPFEDGSIFYSTGSLGLGCRKNFIFNEVNVGRGLFKASTIFK